MPTKQDFVDALRALAHVAPPLPERDTADALLTQHDNEVAEAKRLSTLCRVCEKEPRYPGFDHCCGPNCIPF